MSREIKFRVNTYKGIVYGRLESLATLYPDIDSGWMQYTGLKDKNGVEIYEGDILSTDYGNYFIQEALPFIVLADCNDFSKPEVQRDTYWNGDYYHGGDIEAHHWEEFEVVGNIYENPELLK